MKASNILACSLLFASCLSFNSSVIAANGPKETTFVDNGEKITLSIATKVINGNTSWNVLSNGEWIANADQDCNINAYKAFYDANNYCAKISRSHDSDVWHKNIVHYDSNSENADILVETLATSDAVVEGNIREGDSQYYCMTLFRTKSAAVMKEATGLDIIDKTIEEVENILGKSQHVVECEDPYLLYSFYVDGGSSKRITMYMCDNRITEVLLNNDAPGECESKCGEGWYYSELPEGWYTMGTVTATNLNVRKEPKTGEVIAKIGTDHPEMMFAETKNTKEEYLWLHIITKPSNSENGSEPVDGWVYGKFVSPSFKNFHLESCFSNCFDYFNWLPPFLGEPTSIKKMEPDSNNVYKVTKFWADKGIELTFNVYPNGNSFVCRGKITKDTYAFAGLKVGDNIEKVRKFDSNLDKANYARTNGEAITGNGIMTWNYATEDDNNGETHVVVVEASSGKVSQITFTM